jgi:Uma2 family endonuclease
MAQLPFPRTRPLPELRYVRAPAPIHFPEEAEVPEGKRHFALRTFLFRVLQFALGPAHSLGSDQFVYWNARDARRTLAPDVFVKVDVPDTSFGSWKTWERGGAPELAVEILSPNEGDGTSWEEKLERYHELGVKELVRFDPDAPEGQRLRVWDRVRDDLVERQIGADRTPCLTLGLNWIVTPVGAEPVGLRLTDDGGALLELPEEAAERREEAAERREEAAELRAKNAEARVRELEEQLRRAQSGGGTPGAT